MCFVTLQQQHVTLQILAKWHISDRNGSRYIWKGMFCLTILPKVVGDDNVVLHVGSKWLFGYPKMHAPSPAEGQTYTDNGAMLPHTASQSLHTPHALLANQGTVQPTFIQSQPRLTITRYDIIAREPMTSHQNTTAGVPPLDCHHRRTITWKKKWKKQLMQWCQLMVGRYGCRPIPHKKERGSGRDLQYLRILMIMMIISYSTLTYVRWAM